MAGEIEEGTRHGKGGAPLAGARLRRDAVEALLLRVVGLRDGGVELVAAGGVVAFELVVDFGRRIQFLFKEIGADQRRRAVHAVEVENRLRNRNIRRVVVELLLDEFITEDMAELFEGAGLVGGGIENRRGLGLHVRADIVPCLREFVFG